MSESGRRRRPLVGSTQALVALVRRPGEPSWEQWMRRWCVVLVLILAVFVVVIAVAFPASGWWRWPLGTAVVISVALIAASFSASAQHRLLTDRRAALQGEPVQGRTAPPLAAGGILGICVATATFLIVAGVSLLGSTDWGTALIWWVTGLPPHVVASVALPAALSAGAVAFSLAFVVQAWRCVYVQENVQAFATTIERRDLQAYQRGHRDGTVDQQNRIRE